MAQLALNALHDASPLLVLAVVILVGVAFGAGARRVGLPAVTGQILAGLVIGRAGLDLFGAEGLEKLQPLTGFALGLIAVTVGAHLNLRRLRNAGRRLFALVLTEATVTPALVYVAMRWLGGVTPPLAALFATVAIATAPGTVIALIKETRAKGVFVKTLVAAVALNNMVCILLFELVRSAVIDDGGRDMTAWLSAAAAEIGPAVAIGLVLGTAVDLVTRFALRPGGLATAAVITLVLACGLASTLGVSPLLACLFLGIAQTNLTITRDKLIDSVFSDFEGVILAVFFTLAGMHLSFESTAGPVGLATLLFFLARIAGKVVSADLAMRVAGSTERVRRNLGAALTPQAGVAVGLVVLIQEDPAAAHLAETFAAVVLSAVVLNEISGPILTRHALGRSGEVGKDRLRLIDFLQEENIVTEFHADSQEEAIRGLVDLLVSSHHLDHVDRKELLASVLAREKEASTCLGGGLAVPHGILPGGTPMAGVMALSREGLAFATPDGLPVHCVVLLGTADDARDRHLQVLGMLARNVGTDPTFQEQLFNSRSPAHASELLQGEHSEDFNHFLEDED